MPRDPSPLAIANLYARNSFRAVAAAGLCACIAFGPTLGVTGLARETVVQSSGNAERGASAYRASCGGCHSIDANRIGPRHKGVFGREAGTQEGYNYSSALAAADITWDAASLDEWLTNPRAMVPGTKMAARVSNAERRADIIAYLETLSD